MADTITNMKVRFSADTKQFKKGMDEGQQAMSQFKNTAGSAFDQFASAFGVNMNEIRGGVASLKASLLGINTGFKSAAAGGGFLTKALQVLKVALISTGIGALVVALGSLVAWFTKTEEGGDKLAEIMAGFKAVVNVLVDRFTTLGEKVFWAFTHPLQAVKNLWETIKTNIVNRFEGIQLLFTAVGNGLESLWKRDMTGLKNAAIATASAMGQITTGLDAKQQQALANSIRGLTNEIKEEAKAAVDLAKAKDALEDKEIAFIETEKNYEKQIALNRKKEKEYQLSAEERLAANKKANELVIALEGKRKELQAERVRIMQTEIGLSKATADDYRALAEEKAKLTDIEIQSIDTQKTLLKGAKTLTAEIEAETEAIKKLRIEESAGDDGKQLKSIKTVGLQLDANNFGLELDKLAATIKTGLEPAKDLIINFAETFNSAFTDIATGFGESIGTMLAGTSGFKDIGAIVLGALGDLAINVGKMAVATGIAVMGIKEALLSLNPAVAIAGGIALIAIGTLIKSSLASAAGGGGSTFSGNTGSGGGYSYDTRALGGKVAATTEPIKVQVSGTFRQRGTDMVAVINETQTRQTYKR